MQHITGGATGLQHGAIGIMGNCPAYALCSLVKMGYVLGGVYAKVFCSDKDG